MASVQDAVKRILVQQRHELAGCLLYLDGGAAEAVAVGVGFDALHELGAAAVCDLAASSPCDLTTAALLSGTSAPVRRVAFFITTLLAQAEAAVLAACCMHSAAAQFTVFCGASEAAHHDEQSSLYSSSCYSVFGGAWQHQMNESRRASGVGPCSLAIVYCPLLLCPLTSNAFVLAPGSAAAVMPKVGQLPAGCSTSPVAALDSEDSDEEDQQTPPMGAAARSTTPGQARPPAAPPAAAGLQLLAHTLTGAAGVLGYRPDAFALGPCSRQICRHMAFVPTMAEHAHPAALVLVDRVLDPVSPAQHADLLVQRLYDVLQPSSVGSSNDPTSAAADVGGGPQPTASQLCSEVPMPNLEHAAPETAKADLPDASSSGAGGEEGDRGGHSLLPGSLRHPDDPEAERWLEFLLSRKGRDGPLFVRKWLREAARKENVPQLQRFKPGSISAAELRSLADGLRRQNLTAAYRNASLLQLAEAAAAALEGTHAERWDALQREERALLFACTESPETAAAHLVELCRLAGTPGTPLQLADVMLLMLTVYCLLPDFLPWYAAGEGGTAAAFQPQQERQLMEALVEAVMAVGSAAASSTAVAFAEPQPPARAVAGAPRVAAMSGAAGTEVGPAASPLGQLCRRVALVAAKRAAAGTAAEGPGGGRVSNANDAGEVQREVPAVQQELQAVRLEVRDAVEALLARMREVAALRHSQLKHAKHLAVLGQDGTPQHTPLLRQIVEHVLRDQPLPDLHAGATSLSGLLRSGLGRFGLQKGPKPSDCSTVILFVVGGISIAELHAIAQAVDERATQGASGSSGGNGGSSLPPRIIVGATALLQPGHVCSRLFADVQAA